MIETYTHRTLGLTQQAGFSNRLASLLSYNFGLTAVTLISYFLVWTFASPEAWMSQAFFAEDHVGEWLQFLCCLSIAVVALKTYRLTSRRWLSASILSGGIGMFFIGGEEISWGQRLFNISASPYFSSNNYQGETNLHNMLPLESNIIPYYIAAVVLGVFLNAIGWKLSPPGREWPAADMFFSALVMSSFYAFLPMSRHVYFYEFTELWIYASILIFIVRIRKNFLEEKNSGAI